jgi:uncharacterized protein YbcI
MRERFRFGGRKSLCDGLWDSGQACDHLQSFRVICSTEAPTACTALFESSRDEARERRYACLSRASHGCSSLSRPGWIFHRRDGDGEDLREPELSGGALNAAIANELGKLVAEFTGRGATKSRAFVHQDLVVCLLEDGATRAERNLVAAGKPDLVRLQRDALQRALAPQLIAAVERLTDRKVRLFLSGSDHNGGSAIEAFVLHPETGADERELLD